MKNGKHGNSGITPAVVLEELFVLLEEYGPAWYGEEQHNRALLALNQKSRKKSEAGYSAPEPPNAG